MVLHAPQDVVTEAAAEEGNLPVLPPWTLYWLRARSRRYPMSAKRSREGVREDVGSLPCGWPRAEDRP